MDDNDLIIELKPHSRINRIVVRCQSSKTETLVMDPEFLSNDKDIAVINELVDVLTDIRERCFFEDDLGGIGISEDVVIENELFDRICAALNKASDRIE